MGTWAAMELITGTKLTKFGSLMEGSIRQMVNSISIGIALELVTLVSYWVDVQQTKMMFQEHAQLEQQLCFASRHQESRVKEIRHLVGLRRSGVMSACMHSCSQRLKMTSKKSMPMTCSELA